MHGRTEALGSLRRRPYRDVVGRAHSGMDPTRWSQENIFTTTRTAQQSTTNPALGVAFQHFARVMRAREFVMRAQTLTRASPAGAAQHPPMREVHEAAPGLQLALLHIGIGVKSSHPGRVP
ncbi:hypothetical protein [Actinotignum schaalii]